MATSCGATESAPDHGFLLTESRSIIAGWSPERGTLWVLDRGDGSTLWSITVGEPLTGGGPAPVMPFAAADDERLYVIVGETMTTYAATTGEPLWSVTNPAWAFPPSPAAAESGVVVTGSRRASWRTTRRAATSCGGAMTHTRQARSTRRRSPTATSTSTPAPESPPSTSPPARPVEYIDRRNALDHAGFDPTIMSGPISSPPATGSVLVNAGGGMQLHDAATGEVLWGPNPAPFASRFTTIGPDAVLLGKTCGGD